MADTNMENPLFDGTSAGDSVVLKPDHASLDFKTKPGYPLTKPNDPRTFNVRFLSVTGNQKSVVIKTVTINYDCLAS